MMTHMKNLLTILLILLPFSAYAWGVVVSSGGSTQSAGYSDSFTGDDGTHLYDHDNNWTLATSVSIDDMQIYSNAARANAYRSPCLFYNGSTSDTSQAVIQANIDGSAWAGVTVRASAGYNGYAAALVNPSGGNWTACNVYKNGSYVGATAGTWAMTSSHTIKITVSGTSTVTIKTWVDGAALSDQSDSSSTITNGHPGIWMRNESNGAASIMLDDWADH